MRKNFVIYQILPSILLLPLFPFIVNSLTATPIINNMGDVMKYSDPESLKDLIPSLIKLSEGTEMSSYKEAKWKFLLGGGNDIVAYVLPDTITNGDDDDNSNNNILGCVLRIRLKKAAMIDDKKLLSSLPKEDSGYGMMLVSPKARGQGYAKKLLRAAMLDGDEDDLAVERRHILAVCTKLGQPMYSKLGFETVGKVVAISSTKLGNIRESTTKNVEKNETTTTTTYMHPIDPRIQKLVIDMDKDITGYDRTDRLSYLLNESTNVMVGISRRNSKTILDDQKSDDNDDNILAIVVMRQDCPEGPIIVGPILTSDDDSSMKRSIVVVSLIQTMTKSHPGDDDLSLSMLLNCDDDDDDENLDELFLNCGASFTKDFNFPAMAKDNNKAIYQKNKNYLALIHPTLG